MSGDSSPDEAARPDESDRAVLWLRRGDRLFLTVMVAALLVLTSVHWYRLSRGGTFDIEDVPRETRPFSYRIDINQATTVDWMQLEGIGETMARRIVAYRDEHGPFASIDDLDNVPGIGPKTLESLRSQLKRLEEEDAAPAD